MEMIHAEQTYCVPSRHISDNIHLILHIMDVCGSFGVDTGLICLDQEKAFDRFEHQHHLQVQPRIYCQGSGHVPWRWEYTGN